MADDSDDLVRERIAEALTARHLDLAPVSRAIGKNHAYLHQYLNKRKPVRLPEEVRHALASFLELPEPSLRSKEMPDLALATFTTRGPPPWSRQDLPVYSSAEGGPGGIIFEPKPIDFVTRPDPLFTARDGYAIYLVGNSMSPVYDQGDLLLIHPHLPFRSGSDVLIYRPVKDGPQYEATVKRLQSATADEWHLQQFNPAETFPLPRQAWPVCHVIVGKYSRR